MLYKQNRNEDKKVEKKANQNKKHYFQALQWFMVMRTCKTTIII